MELMIALQIGGGQGGVMQLVMLALMFVVMWFFFMRPQIKKQKEAQKFTEEVKVGNQIVTSGGIVGKILKMDDKTITINTGDTKLTLLKSAISKDLTDQFNGKKEK